MLLPQDRRSGGYPLWSTSSDITSGDASSGADIDVAGGSDITSRNFSTSSPSNSTSAGGGIRRRKKKTSNIFRADRVLANRGWGTRSACFAILKAKRVYIKRDDGEFVKVSGPSERITMRESLWVDCKKEVPMPAPLLRVYHKPKWVLSVIGDKKGRKNLESLEFAVKMHPVGRLDYDTSGLLLFSTKGALTQTLLHPSHHIEKEYSALVEGEVTQELLAQRLAEGVNTTIGTFPAKLIEASIVPSSEVPVLIKEIMDNLPPEYDVEKLTEDGHLDFQKAEHLSRVRLIVEEGKHRMVRRILANLGHPVIGLKRERLGEIVLGDDLPVGEYRELTEAEDKWASRLLKRGQ